MNENIYDEVYMLLYKFKEQTIAADISAIKTKLILKKSDKILDIACGYGRVMKPLVEEGFDVHGMDLSRILLDKAVERGIEYDRLTQGNFNNLSNMYPKGEFDKAYCMFTSIGMNKEDDESMFQELNSVLKSGGLFLLEYRNFLNDLIKPKVSNSWNKVDNGVYWLTTSRMDFLQMKSSTYNEVIDLSKGAVIKSYEYFLNLYPFDELKEMGDKAGFDLISIQGKLSMKEPVPSDQFVIFVFRKR